MIPVNNSSSIAAYEYNAQAETLVVESVKSTGTYTFFDVPQVVFDEFERAESKGKYFYAYIRGRYRFVKHDLDSPTQTGSGI
jgi:hypothetical protein